MTRPVGFSEEGARRIVAATRAYEGSGRNQSPIKFRQTGGDDGDNVRLGTIASSWTKGETATVTQQNGDGTAMVGNPTFTAKNYFASVTVSSGTKRVACALVGSTWILIAAEC